jgi:hypothetical protein
VVLRTGEIKVGPNRCVADSTAKDNHQAFNASSLSIIMAGCLSLQIYRLIFGNTSWDALKATEQVFLLITDDNRKGNLKRGPTCLL